MPEARVPYALPPNVSNNFHPGATPPIAGAPSQVGFLVIISLDRALSRASLRVTGTCGQGLNTIANHFRQARDH